MMTAAELIKARKDLFEEIYKKASEAEELVIKLVEKCEHVTKLLAQEMNVVENGSGECQGDLRNAAQEFNETYKALVPLVTELTQKYEKIKAEERRETIVTPNADMQVQTLIVTMHKFIALDNSLIQLKKITDSIVSN